MAFIYPIGNLTLYESFEQGFNMNQFYFLIFLLLLLRKFFRYFLVNYVLFNIKDKVKMSDSIFYVICLAFSITVGETSAYGQSWRTNYLDSVIGYPDTIYVEPLLKFYYTFSLAFYVYSIITLLIDEKKKDFFAMLVHHIATFWLISMSGVAYMHKAGSIITLTFDICDIFLEFAKIFRKFDSKYGTISCFVMFVFFWVKNRMINFPLYIIPIFSNLPELSGGHPIAYHEYLWPFLYVIMVLQIYWSYFIVKKILGLIHQGFDAAEDPREKRE